VAWVVQGDARAIPGSAALQGACQTSLARGLHVSVVLYKYTATQMSCCNPTVGHGCHGVTLHYDISVIL